MAYFFLIGYYFLHKFKNVADSQTVKKKVGESATLKMLQLYFKFFELFRTGDILISFNFDT